MPSFTLGDTAILFLVPLAVALASCLLFEAYVLLSRSLRKKE